jgi:CheY-like chemotaxis protein
VILNLAVNARDAMPDGGTLSIRLDNASVDEESAPTSGLFGPCVVLSVNDTGTGMDEATKSRVFEPFFTTKPVGKGTGLGLATVFGVVKQSGGHIAVTTDLGKGTTFTIHLPRWEGAVERATSVRSVPTSALRGDETVLLVEDDAQVRALMLGILERAGYRTLEAPGPEDALARSRRFEEEIHLLVTDIVMPKMSGRQLVDALAGERPAMKILYVSGYSEDAIAHRGALDAGVALLRKPVTPVDLLQRVREVLDGE